MSALTCPEWNRGSISNGSKIFTYILSRIVQDFNLDKERAREAGTKCADSHGLASRRYWT